MKKIGPLEVRDRVVLSPISMGEGWFPVCNEAGHLYVNIGAEDAQDWAHLADPATLEIKLHVYECAGNIPIPKSAKRVAISTVRHMCSHLKHAIPSPDAGHERVYVIRRPRGIRWLRETLEHEFTVYDLGDIYIVDAHPEDVALVLMRMDRHQPRPF